MKKAEQKVYKERLLEIRARMRGDVSAMATSALSAPTDGSGSSMPSHLSDGGDTYEQHNTLSIMDTEGETLDQIEAALERIEEGVYGLCVECEGRIPKLRLNAIPYTPYCVKCASELESQGN
jgi:DnaK suppressor protein